MIEYHQLLRKLLELPFELFEGILFRRIALAALQSITPQQFLYALGAGKEGARFTPRNGPPCLYASLEETTAEAEFKQNSFADFRNKAAPPSVVYSLQTRLEKVIDLTNVSNLQKLKINQKELAASWRLHPKNTSTQTLGMAAYNCGKITALKYPSTRHSGGICYVIFTERLEKSSFVELYDPQGIFTERIPIR